MRLVDPRIKKEVGTWGVERGGFPLLNPHCIGNIPAFW